VADVLRETLGQPLVIVNRDGASGAIGNTAVAQAKPDGYTFGYTGIGPITIQPHLMKDLRFSPASFEAVCQVSDLPFALTVKKESRIKTLQEFIAAAKAAPGKISYGVAGTNTTSDLMMIEFGLHAGIQLIRVPYRGEAPMLGPLMSGELDAVSVTTGFAETQKLHILGTYTRERVKEVPGAPTFIEQGYPMVHTVPTGIVAPRGVVPEIIAKMEAACERAVKDERVVRVHASAKQPLAYVGSRDFAATIARNHEAIGRLVQRAGIKPQ